MQGRAEVALQARGEVGRGWGVQMRVAAGLEGLRGQGRTGRMMARVFCFFSDTILNNKTLENLTLLERDHLNI